MSVEDRSILKNVEDGAAVDEAIKEFEDKERLYRQYVEELKGDFDLREFFFTNSAKCEDIFQACDIWFQTLDCCDMFHPILTSIGVCYTLSLQGTNITSPEMMSVKLRVPQTFLNFSMEGFLLLMHDPSSLPNRIAWWDGEMISPGSAVVVEVEMELQDHTEKYKTDIVKILTCPDWWFQGADLRYTDDNCQLVKRLQIIQETCRCTPVVDFWDGAPRQKFCEPLDMVQCVLPISNLTSAQFEQCVPECYQFDYEMTSSHTGLGPLVGSHEVREKSAELIIFYDSSDFTYVEFHRFRMTVFMSEIGGTLGLLLGASAITVAEVVEYFARLVCHHVYRLWTATRSRRLAKIGGAPRSKWGKSRYHYRMS